MKRETTTFIIQQLIVISILVLVNVYYYQRLSSTFVDKSLVKHTGAIEQMKSQIGLSLNMEDVQNFTTFMGKVKTDYSDLNIKNISSYNPLNVIKEGYEGVQNNSDQSGQSNTSTNETQQSQQKQENVEQTTSEQNTSEQQPTSIITCQEVIEQYPQKDMNFSISGTNLDDFQTMFKNVKKLQMVCKQQIPIGSIIPFAYYYEKDGSQQYKMLLNESDNTVKNVQILLRTTDNLVLVPLLGGVLTQAMVSKVLGDDCLFIKSVLSKSGNQMTLPNTTKKVLKQVMNGEDQQNLDNSNQSGYAKLIQKIKKTTLFFHDLQNNASWTLQNQGMIYTSPPPNWEIEAKRGGLAKRKATYNVDQGRNEESTKTYYNSQQLTGDEEIDIQDDYAQALFCMVIGYK